MSDLRDMNRHYCAKCKRLTEHTCFCAVCGATIGTPPERDAGADCGEIKYWKDAMKHWQRMFAQARECLQEAMARGAKADDAEMLAKWDTTQRKEIYTTGRAQE